eukprot:CAMPEP_0170576014 /NCGR_PEP_ID=MMETSP0224-20130122/4168_1 /TAXON_ID=285029 /ORGANISM="Togula jolla, Strain CCCM 725" /LENGTH=86 /DNA_ID=CAMNT_0010898831 /DNA_START=39 /DNA_END=295 /DNA_ORIENTATION=-
MAGMVSTISSVSTFFLWMAVYAAEALQVVLDGKVRREVNEILDFRAKTSAFLSQHPHSSVHCVEASSLRRLHTFAVLADARGRCGS